MKRARSRAARACLAAMFGAALVLAAAPPALAHAAYKDSTPAKGETVASPPTQITAEFTEPITDSSYLEVYDPCGVRVDNDDSQVSAQTMSVTMSSDKAGEYTVEFAAQSVDTHVTYGSFSFTSSGGAACAGEEPTDPPPGGGGGGGSGGGGSGGGGGGGGSGSGGGGTTSGGGSGPAGSNSSGGSGGAETAGGGGDSNGGGRHGGHRKGGDAPRGTENRKGGGGSAGPGEPVPFENAGGAAPVAEPAAWDLPIGGVLMALGLCVMIGAAGGRVYAGIVAPPRR